MTVTTATAGLMNSDAWKWWQARRLRYNIALGTAAWIAYGLNAAQFYAFNHPIWESWQGGVAMTLFLGTLFLFVMGIANVLFLLGPWTERVTKPADVDGYRKTAWALGLYGSIAVPFIFPLLNFAMLIGQSGKPAI
ncbi:MAG: hypothetical protein WCI21_08025 [Alphaproteobacteria bacterium]